MLNKIKTKYFFKNIFVNINEKAKLNIIKNNKSLQNLLNIKLINYKILSGKYIIKKSNELWEIYDAFDEALIFEGNYLHGKGKEYYDNGNLLSEGEYLNGKVNGNFKEYYPDGKLLSEGEYINDKRWNVKIYNKDGNITCEIKNGKGIYKEFNNKNNHDLLFESEILNGEINGKGKEYYCKDCLKYEGYYLNGKWHGKGKEYYLNGQIKFEGEYFNGGKWNVKEYDINGNVIYEIKNGRGFIKEYNQFNKLIYEGNYIYGTKNGIGKEYYLDKLKFEGEYLNDEKNGRGKQYNSKGELIFEGEYLYNYKIKGRQYIKGKLEYEGEFLYNLKYNGKGYDENGNIIYELINGNGKVKEYYAHDTIKFEGEYLNGKRHGKGKEYSLIGKLIYDCDYLNGLKNGKGKEYNQYGNLCYEGEFLNGERNGHGKEYDNEGNLIFEGNYMKGERVN